MDDIRKIDTWKLGRKGLTQEHRGASADAIETLI